MKKLLLTFLLTSTAFAQTAEKPKPHPFFDVKNKVLFSSTAAAMVADAYTTQGMLADRSLGNYEQNPLAKPFVKLGWGGQVAASGLAFSAAVGSSYFLHRHNHHRWERVVPLAVMITSGYLARRNSRIY